MDPSVDPSDRSVENREEKRIKLIQQGDLDQFGFEQEDPVFDHIPGCDSTINCRNSISSYS